MQDAPETTASRQTPTTTARTLTIYRPAIVAMLFLANFVVGFSVFVGLVLAYVWRGEPETLEWEKTHFTYLIRTFWIGLALIMLAVTAYIAAIAGIIVSGGGGAPSPAFFAMIFGMFVLWLISAAWFTARCVVSLVKVGSQRPMPNPETWWF